MNSLFPPGWLVQWTEGRRRRCGEYPDRESAERGALCVSVLMPPGKVVRVYDPAGAVVLELKWEKRRARNRKRNPVEAVA